MGFDPETVGVYFIPGTFPISAMRDRIRKEMQAIGDFSLVVIDTSAAFFEGEDENSNAQQGVHADSRIEMQPGWGRNLLRETWPCPFRGSASVIC